MKKRDFEWTTEPLDFARGKPSKKGERLAFVVQKHHASHLHYDFRLEMNGVLKSWAVPKGPPLRAGEKRLAVMTEDHPLSYARFHGTIPKGQYGAGKVRIWDKGTYEPKGPLSAGLRRGSVTIHLQGKKLRGSYSLVRLKDLKNWLLIKQRS